MSAVGCVAAAIAAPGVEATLTRPALGLRAAGLRLRLLPPARRGMAVRSERRLRLLQRDADAALHYRQGSDQADFIACAHCAVLVDGHLRD